MNTLGALGLVVGRELKEAGRRRSTWVVVVLALAGSTALVVLPELLGGNSRRVVAVTPDAPPGFAASLRAVAGQTGVDTRTTAAPAGELRRLVRAGTAGAAVDFGTTPPTVVVRTVGDDPLGPLLQQVVARSDLTRSLQARGLGSTDVAAALADSQPRVREVEPERGGRTTAAFLASLVLYLLLLMLTTGVASGVAIEKSRRISEVLLSIVRPVSLLFGKVIGVGLVGLLTLAAGALPITVKLLAGGDLPPGTGSTLAGGAAWFVLGIALYLSLAGGLGALVDRQEQVGSIIAPLSLVLVAAYLAGVSLADSPTGMVLSIVPLTSPMVMPARLALGEAGAGEIVASLVALLVTVAVVVRLAAVVYERAIVRTGRRLTVREVLRSGGAGRPAAVRPSAPPARTAVRGDP